MATTRLAREVLESEITGLTALDRLLEGPAFGEAVEILDRCRGRIVVSGVGKSGLVAQRIAASFRSTGTPAVYLHPVEAMHGDLGLLDPADVGLFLSKSGESEELLRLLPIFERIPLPLVAIVCRGSSSLGRAAARTLVLGPIEEAGPLKLVPTTSTTVFQVLGDLLVTCLYARRGTTESELAYLHPGGVIGTQATLRVADLMHAGERLPRVGAETFLRDALVEMIDKKLGMTTVVDATGSLVGILTDGDIRRIVHRHRTIDSLHVREVMSPHPRTIGRDARVAAAVERMENNPGGPITCLVVTDGSGRPEGVIHLHDCLRARKAP